MAITIVNVFEILLGWYALFLVVDLYVSYRARTEYLRWYMDDLDDMSYINIFGRAHSKTLMVMFVTVSLVFIADFFFNFIK